jgi:hypothetical protein
MCRLQLCSRVLRSNPVKLSAGDFEAQIKPPKLAGEAYPLRLLDDLDTCHRPFYTAWSAGPLAPPLDLVNTVYSSICTLARRCPPSVSHPRSFFRPSRSLGPSLTSTVHRSQSIGMTHLYLTFCICIDRLYVPHLHITSQETCYTPNAR